MKEYEKCFVYQCLASVCHGANLESPKFIQVCLDCPCFRAWLEKKKGVNGMEVRPCPCNGGWQYCNGNCSECGNLVYTDHTTQRKE